MPRHCPRASGTACSRCCSAPARAPAPPASPGRADRRPLCHSHAGVEVAVLMQLIARHGVLHLRTHRAAIRIEIGSALRKELRLIVHVLPAAGQQPASPPSPKPHAEFLRSTRCFLIPNPCSLTCSALMVHLHHGDRGELLEKRPRLVTAKTSDRALPGKGRTCPSSRRCGSSAR
jgi:hypothetical protein